MSKRIQLGPLSAIFAMSIVLTILAGGVSDSGATVVSTTGAVTVISPPTSVKAGAIATDLAIYLFLERSSYSLAVDRPINAYSPSTYSQNSQILDDLLPTGTTIDSYYLHYDAKGLTGGSAAGSVTFSNPIMGIIEKDGDLHSTNDFGEPATSYPGRLSDTGYEFGGDVFTISSDRRTLTVDVSTGVGVDDLRILVSSVGLGSCALDLVFVQDTSGSMVDEANILASSLAGAVNELVNAGMDVSSTYWGIVDTAVGSPVSSVADELGATVPGGSCFGADLYGCAGGSERWGDATAIVAERFPWRTGSIRAIVPVSDTTACCADNGNSSVNNAVARCNENAVQAFPIMGSLPQPFTQLNMEALAAGTNGAFIPKLESAAQISQALFVAANVACAKGCIPPVAAFTMADSLCADMPVILDGTGSFGGSSYYVEICPIGVDCNTYGWSSWLPGQPGVMDLRDYYDFTVTEQYNIKLAMSNSCDPWDEKTQVLTIIPKPVVTFDQISPLSICAPTIVNAQISGVSGSATIQWSVIQGGIETPLPNTTTVLALDPASGNIDGRYRILVSDSTGCATENFIEVACGCDFSDSAWNGLGLGVGPTGTRVNALLLPDNASIDPLYAAGDFSSMNGKGSFGVARLSAGTWTNVGVVIGSVKALAWYQGEVYIGGVFTLPPSNTTVYAARWVSNSWQEVPGVTGEIIALEVHDDGAGAKLYAGGDFPEIIAYDGSIWNSVTTVSGATPKTVDLESVEKDGLPALAIGGIFTDLGGVSGTANVALLQDSQVLSLDGGLPLETGVYALAEYDDGSGPSLCVGGEITEGVRAIALNGTGTWGSLGGGVQGGWTFALTAASYCDRRVLVAAGSFNSAGLQSVNRIAAWDGSSWMPLAGGFFGVLRGAGSNQPGDALARKVEPQPIIFALEFQGKHLFAGGDFRTVDGIAVRGIAEWTCQPISVNGPWWTPIDPGWTGRETVGAGTPIEFAAFGGYDGIDRLDETWVFSGGQWAQRFPASVPSARTSAEMIRDTARDVYVMHGGTNGAPLNETWEYDGVDWSLRSTSGPPFYSAGFAFDSQRGVAVWYGGNGVGGRSRSTLEWDGSTWTNVVDNSPPGYRSNLAMAYNPVTRRCVMFGGQLPGNVYAADTWVYDGVWKQIPAVGPSARRFHTLTYDPVNGGILLYGGENDSGVLGDTWLFRNDTWTLVDAGGVIPGLRGHAAFFENATGLLHLAGGYDGTAFSRDDFRFEVPVLAATGVTEPVPAVLQPLMLRVRPNPFNPLTSIEFAMTEAGHVNLTVYSIAGRVVVNLVDSVLPPGVHSTAWRGVDRSGRRVSSGTYLLRLVTPEGVTTGKVVLAK